MHSKVVTSARPSRPSPRVAARTPLRSTGIKQRTSVVTSAKTKSVGGFRWDGANLRWVKDDRYTGKSMTKIKPKTGVEYTAWPVVQMTLASQGLKSLTPEEAQALARKGWTLVDVRLESDYDWAHAEGAVSVPLYRYVEGNSFWDNAKRVAMAGFAMKATERVPDYGAAALSSLKKNQKVILMCNIGGTLETTVSYRREKKIFADPERQFGRESRALKAAYELMQAGWSVKNMAFVAGGLQQWRYDGLPLE